jgi:hypothetical protein
MRTLICVRDIQEEVAKPIVCPRCGSGSTPLQPIQSHIEMTPKGKVVVQKSAVCAEHGCFSLTSHIKAVQMFGKDAQIVPRY